MAAPTSLKTMARRLGLYQPARRLWRRVDPSVRQSLRADMALYSRFIPAGSLVFDIGANKGEKTEVFLKLGAHVVAVEPNPNCTTVLGRDQAGNPHLTLVQAALGRAPGTATVHFKGDATTASLRADWAPLLKTRGALETQQITVTTLDRLIETHGVPAFCKIDVEGFEPEVLAGLSQPLPCLSLEFFSTEAEAITTCLQRLMSFGDYEANATRLNAHELVLDDWIGPQRFLDLLGTEALPRSGDVFLRLRPPV